MIASQTGYNLNGQMTALFLGNGRTTSYDYDPLHFRLTGLTTDGDLQVLAYAYDPVGNVLAVVDAINSNQAQTFSYDALNRLLTAQSNNQDDGQYEQNYAYNAIGNMTRMAHLCPPLTFPFSCSGRSPDRAGGWLGLESGHSGKG
jgi:YD repeat-containing protein